MSAVECLEWIVGELENRQIPYAIGGGMAARAYGATRPLHDIDIDLPELALHQLVPVVHPFIEWGPGRWLDENFDLTLVTLRWKGQVVDLVASETIRLFDRKLDRWVELPTDLTRVVRCSVLGREVALLPQLDLIHYKAIISRVEDLQDIREITSPFQDQGTSLECFGCGTDNSHGLRLKSFWQGEEAIATVIPEPYYIGGASNIVYGGLIASLLDCHACNLAMAQGYRRENRPIGSEPKVQCVTAQLNISLLKPTPLGQPLQLRARLRSVEGRKSWVECEVSVAGEVTAKGEILAIRLKS